ncbi:unnamed protein product [Lactuca saligna]|uniref:Vps16 N-terminal domain-containing protein n=1 Tax=Lactuca saligna TaxID=75948 RepID=A0AA35V577_LACSI|nr:unnamed protein product [Lactuca saligna]
MDSVLLYWDDMLLMVGPYGDLVRYLYDEPIILILECDGARILTKLNMEFLQRVPSSTESIFKIGSTEPTYLLYDALDHFYRRNAKVCALHFNAIIYTFGRFLLQLLKGLRTSRLLEYQEIPRLTLTLFPIFNLSPFPHNPPPASVANPFHFTDVGDGDDPVKILKDGILSVPPQKKSKTLEALILIKTSLLSVSKVMIFLSSYHLIASHIVRVHQKHENDVAPAFTTAQLKCYIQVAKSKKPKLSAETRKSFVDSYVALPKGDTAPGSRVAYSMTVR